MQAIENEEPEHIISATYMVYDYLDEIQGIKEVIETKFLSKVPA